MPTDKQADTILDFVQWLDEIFVDVRVTTLEITAKGEELVISTRRNSGTTGHFAVVIWGVKKEFYEELVLPRVPNVPGATYGCDKYERFYFCVPSTTERLFGRATAGAGAGRLVGEQVDPDSRVVEEGAVIWHLIK
jgi:hypothetical protein